MRPHFVLVAVFALVCIAASGQNAGPYAFDQLMQNNTAACSQDSYGLLGKAYCYEGFPSDNWFNYYSGWADEQAYGPNNDMQAPILTLYHDPSPAGTWESGTTWNGVWNIAKQRTPQDCTKCPDPADLHSLMYGTGADGQATKIVVWLESWFCDPNAPLDQGTECPNTGTTWTPRDPYNQVPQQSVNLYESHAEVQYTAWNQDTMNARTVDIWDRGGDDAAMDWYGAPSDCPETCTTQTCNYNIDQFTNACSAKFQYADHSYLDMVYSIQTFLPEERPNAHMGFLMVLDDGGWNSPSVCGVNDQSPNTNYGYYEPQCALDKMESDLMYALSNYLNQTNYLKVTSNEKSRPVIALFQNEGNPGTDDGSDFAQCNSATCYYDDDLDQCGGPNNGGAANCYAEVYGSLRNWLNSQLGMDNYYLIFAHEDGCPNGMYRHPSSDGCYFWIKPHQNPDPSQVTVENQLYNDQTQGDTSPQISADDFYANSVNAGNGTNGQPALIMGGVYKGFDDWMAMWWTDRILTQGCGTTWLSSWAEMTYEGDYGPTNPLPFVAVETWDDYEEGTEIETGISNCLVDSSFALTFNNPTLAWSYDFNDPDPHDLSPTIDNTVDHYVLWYSVDGSNYYIMDPTLLLPKRAAAQAPTT
jgi:hypothetical protein